MDGSLSLQTAYFDELDWDPCCMNHSVLLTVAYCVALLQVDTRSCHDHTGWAAGFSSGPKDRFSMLSAVLFSYSTNVFGEA